MALAAEAALSYPVQYRTSLDLVSKWKTHCVYSKHPSTLGSQKLFTSWLLEIIDKTLMYFLMS